MPSEIQAVALYPYTKAKPDQLDLEKNETYICESLNGYWWTCHKLSNPSQSGKVPYNRLQIIQSDDFQPPTAPRVTESPPPPMPELPEEPNDILSPPPNPLRSTAVTIRGKAAQPSAQPNSALMLRKSGTAAATTHLPIKSAPKHLPPSRNPQQRANSRQQEAADNQPSSVSSPSPSSQPSSQSTVSDSSPSTQLLSIKHPPPARNPQQRANSRQQEAADNQPSSASSPSQPSSQSTVSDSSPSTQLSSIKHPPPARNPQQRANSRQQEAADNQPSSVSSPSPSSQPSSQPTVPDSSPSIHPPSVSAPSSSHLPHSVSSSSSLSSPSPSPNSPSISSSGSPSSSHQPPSTAANASPKSSLLPSSPKSSLLPSSQKSSIPTSGPRSMPTSGPRSSGPTSGPRSSGPTSGPRSSGPTSGPKLSAPSHHPPSGAASSHHPPSGAASSHHPPPSVAAPTHSQPPSVAAPTPSQPPSVAAPSPSQPPSIAAPTPSQPPSIAAPTPSQPPSIAAPSPSQPPSIAAPSPSQPPSIAAPSPSTRSESSNKSSSGELPPQILAPAPSPRVSAAAINKSSSGELPPQSLLPEHPKTSVPRPGAQLSQLAGPSKQNRVSTCPAPPVPPSPAIDIPPPAFDEFTFGEEETDQNVKYKDENGKLILVGGTIEKILEKNITDQKGMLTLLHCYSAYITSNQLLKLLKSFFIYIKDKLDKNNASINEKESVFTGFTFFMKEMINKHYESIKNEAEAVGSLLELLRNEELISTTAAQLTNSYHNQVDLFDIYLPQEPKAPEKSFVFLNISPELFAQQLTLLEYEIYDKITSSEFINSGWLKEDGDKRSPHLRELSDVSNNIGPWIGCEILQQKSPKDRRAIIEHCLEIAEILYEIHNFNGLVEVVAGLFSRSIFRLKKSFKEKSMAKCEEYNLLIDKNYREMRNLLASVEPPCLPYVGMYLTDIIFVNGTNMINWSKCTMEWNSIETLLSHQKSPFPFQPNPQLISFIKSLIPSMNDDQMYQKSLEIEPRNK